MRTAFEKINEDRSKTREERIYDGIAAWASFYRENPHRFVEDYLGIHLKRFQQIILVMMDWYVYFCYIAARGQGKSFLLSIFCCDRCILYPGTQVCIAAGRRSQSINILEYIQNQLIPKSANLRSEIESITLNTSKAECVFKNGSAIKVVTAADSARGNRAHILLIDEYRLVAEDIVNTVLRKFRSDERHPPYVDNPKYATKRERNKEIYLSSAYFKSHWAYTKVTDYFKNMVDDSKKYFVCGLPYQLSIEEGLYNPEQALDEMSEPSFNETLWSINISVLLKPTEPVYQRGVYQTI